MSELAGAAYILRPGEGRSIDLGGFRMSVKAADEQTNGAFSLLDLTKARLGVSGPVFELYAEAHPEPLKIAPQGREVDPELGRNGERLIARERPHGEPAQQFPLPSPSAQTSGQWLRGTGAAARRRSDHIPPQPLRVPEAWDVAPVCWRDTAAS